MSHPSPQENYDTVNTYTIFLSIALSYIQQLCKSTKYNVRALDPVLLCVESHKKIANTRSNNSNFKQMCALMLTDTNYELWSIKMQTFLQLNKCWDMVENEFKESDSTIMYAMSNN